MKKHALRRLRAALAGEPCLYMHAPALDQIANGVCSFIRPSDVAAEVRREVLARDKVLAYDDEEDDESEDTSPIVSGQIAIVPIVGVLTQRQTWYGMGLEQLESTLHGLARDSKIKGVVLFFDTPGGSAMGTEEVAEAIGVVRAAGKPVVAFIKGMAASAGYYLASQAEQIVATKSSMAGSIGVVIAHVEMADLLKEWGIGVNVITHGINKWAANPYQKLSERGRAELQRTVASFGKLFDEAVAKGRSVSVAAVKEKFGQGSMFLADEAQRLGLIDAVGSLSDVLSALRSRLEQPTRENMRSGGQEGPGEGHGLATLRSSIASLASTPVAGSSATSIPASAGQAKETTTVSMKIKAALFARGLIAAIDAADDICQAALAGWFAATGKALPTAEDDILATLNGAGSGAAAAAAAAGGANADKPADNVLAAKRKELEEAAAEKERFRIVNLQASGRLMAIDPKQIEEGIKSGKSDSDVLAGWVEAKAKQDPPVNAANPRITGEGADRFMADALVGLQLRANANVAPNLITHDTRRMSQAPLIVLAQQCLAMSGQRIDPYAAPEDIAEAALAMDHPRNITPGAMVIRPSADDPAYNRPGSFPNLLSNLANKILDDGLELAVPTYPEWCGRYAGDLNDFKPAPIVNKGVTDELDTVTDAEALKELGLGEEMLAYIQIARFANKFAWTPVLIANDDLNAFAEGMLGLAGAHENTLNRLCLSQLTGNVTLLDGFALYDDTNHGNDITGGNGGVPSDTEWSDMQNKLSAQRGIGGTGYVRGELAIALVPPTLERNAIQTFATPSVIVEVKTPATDATTNIYRGKVKIVKEPELRASSTAIWYGLMQPRGTLNATVIYAYFRGYGQGGRRETWYDPNTKCRYTSIEGRFAAAAKQYRTTVRNAGA
jgi:signal peptide peptidase SppA